MKVILLINKYLNIIYKSLNMNCTNLFKTSHFTTEAVIHPALYKIVAGYKTGAFASFTGHTAPEHGRKLKKMPETIVGSFMSL